MSHKRWQALRLQKLEERLREFSAREHHSAQTYERYASITDRRIPGDIKAVVARLSSGTIGETSGALAVLYAAQETWATSTQSENAIESLEERFRIYAQALVEHGML